ncbi:sensor histidine kinase [Saccharomonospora azurea]|uniref:sensor histidine kinase n=1 Tax=Saccharomonospora azurea TaxID=40988 RepID=UPI00240936B1|nr:sensor histidine kinase [Saccharomonospora azurea]
MTVLERDEEPCWPRWRRPLPTRRQQRNDVLVALAVLAGAVFTVVVVRSMGLAFNDDVSLGEQVLWGAAVVAPIVVRRRYPLATLAAVGVLFIVAQARGMGENVVPSIALFLAIYSTGAWERRRVAARWARITVIVAMFVWLGIAIVRLLVEPTVEFPGASGPLNPLLAAVLYDVGFNAMFFLSAYFFGEMAWLSARRQAELAYRAEQLRRSQEENTRGAIVAERLRIARELHDVVAHHVSVMGIQAGAARRVIDTDRELARTALDTVEETARAAIEELRGLLGVLRAEPGEAASEEPESSRESSPDLEDLPGLVERTRSESLDVAFAVYGEPYPVSDGVALSIYRVTQEALTNVVKHSLAGSVDVRLRYLDSGVEVEITDDGRGPSGPGRPQGSGLGLVGMRERVAVHGGELETGPRPTGGYRVRAVFPQPARRRAAGGADVA